MSIEPLSYDEKNVLVVAGRRRHAIDAPQRLTVPGMSRAMVSQILDVLRAMRYVDAVLADDGEWRLIGVTPRGRRWLEMYGEARREEALG